MKDIIELHYGKLGFIVGMIEPKYLWDGQKVYETSVLLNNFCNFPNPTIRQECPHHTVIGQAYRGENVSRI